MTNVVKNIGNIIIAPTKVFKDIDEYDSRILPTVVLTFIFALAALANISSFRAEALVNLQQRVVGFASSENPRALLNFTTNLSLAKYVAGVIVRLVVKTGLVYAVARKIGGVGELYETFTVLMYCTFVLALGALVKTALVTVGGINLTFSLVDVIRISSPWRSIVVTFDLFTVWYLGLSVIGVSLIHEIKKVKAGLIVILPTVIYSLDTIVASLVN